MLNSKMKLANIIADTNFIDKVLTKLMKFPCIEPVPSEKITQSVHGSKPYQTTDISASLLKEIVLIESGYHTFFNSLPIEGVSASLNEISKEIKEVHHILEDFTEHMKLLNGLLAKYENAFQQIRYLSSLEVSLDDIFKCDYIVSRVGKLPLDSVDKLRYYHTTPFIFTSFAVENNTSWCMYFTTNGYERAVDNVFSSLLFERIYIPDFVHGTPESAMKALSLEIEETKRQVEIIQKQMDEYLLVHNEIVTKMKSELELIEKIHDAEKYIVILGSKFSFTGFILAKDEEKLRELFSGMSEVSVEIHPSDFDKRLKSPRKIAKKTCK